jgi:hypothetical protein
VTRLWRRAVAALGAVLLALPSAAQAPPEALTAEDRVRFQVAADAAWAFVDRNYQPATGLVRAHDTYPYVTAWDMGSTLAALYSAHALGLLPAEEYEVRMARALRTLESLPLYDGAAFNKLYDARSGAMMARGERRSRTGYGWSTLDVGRLLAWLHIVGRGHSGFEPLARRVAERVNFGRLVRDGYLRGQDLHPRTGAVREYQEGRIGYEQYAAEAFARWGHPAAAASSLRENTAPVTVEGVELLGDARGDDRLTSEPFVMMGLEFGWDTGWDALARAVLAAQEARWRRTGQVTVVSEDAVPVPPYHFYYYSVYQDGRAWHVGNHGTADLGEPRWVSAKAAMGWLALLPGDYTRLAAATVEPARTREGWASGVYEGSGRSTGAANINTAAVILTAALYVARGGRPIAAGATDLGR